MMNVIESKPQKRKMETSSLSSFSASFETENVVLGYYPAWMSNRGYQVEDIPFDKVTHVNYAFMDVAEDGKVVFSEQWADSHRKNFPKFKKLNGKYPNLTTLLSIGGWTNSKNFSNAALTDENRRRFALTAIEKMRKGGFDGIDIDWEYPSGGGMEDNIERKDDPTRFINLLEECRGRLDRVGRDDGKEYYLTAAVSPSSKSIDKLSIPKMVQYLDLVNVMTYDYIDPSDDLTSFNAPLYSHPDSPLADRGCSDSSIHHWLSQGVPSKKLTMGLPFYGRGFAGVSEENDGLFQEFSRIPKGTWGKGPIFEYWDLQQNYEIDSNYTRYWSSESKVPWLYSPSDGVFISYDDPKSVGIKTEYAADNDLAGVMFWHIGQDRNERLIDTICSKLGRGTYSS